MNRDEMKIDRSWKFINVDGAPGKCGGTGATGNRGPSFSLL